MLAVFGERHPGVALCYNNIGQAYASQGDYESAMYNYEKALDIGLSVFGERHPDVARDYNNIGLAYASQGDYVSAMSNCQKALISFYLLGGHIRLWLRYIEILELFIMHKKVS